MTKKKARKPAKREAVVWEESAVGAFDARTKYCDLHVDKNYHGQWYAEVDALGGVGAAYRYKLRSAKAAKAAALELAKLVAKWGRAKR